MATPSASEGTVTVSSGGPELAYSLHRPAVDPTGSLKLCLIAHPLGRLGGNRNDHVVIAVTRALVEEGWTVCRYDSRGAGESTGSPSWTCEAEVQDFQDVVKHVLLPLIPSPSPPTHLLLAGYSAGSLAASRFRLPPTLSSSSSIHLSYLLLSYPLSVLPFLTLFHSSAFHAALAELVRSGAPVLAVYGDGDQFTGVGKFDAWAAKLASEEGGAGWRSRLVEGADHFWQDRERKAELVAEVRGWARGLVDG